jgi:hypothetical protein
MINRLSCSTCSFAKTERVSDITLADCIHDLNKKEKKYGCSYVLVNTELGKQLLSKCDVNVTPIDIVLIRKFQSHLNEPQHFHKYRPCIMNNINRGFSFLLTNYMSPPKRNIVRSIKSRTKSIKERIKHV